MLQKPGPDCSLSKTLDFECAKITVSSLRSATLVQEGIYMQFGYYLKQKLANTEAQELLVLVGKVVEETLFKGSSGVEFNVSTEDLGGALGASIKMEGDRPHNFKGFEMNGHGPTILRKFEFRLHHLATPFKFQCFSCFCSKE